MRRVRDELKDLYHDRTPVQGAEQGLQRLTLPLRLTPSNYPLQQLILALPLISPTNLNPITNSSN